MKIDGIHSAPELPDSSGGKGKTPDGASFGDSLKDAMNKVVEAQKEAETAVKGLAEGNGTDVHTAMLAMEKADISFRMMMQARNKIISAYEEIMRMQV